jgi:hypothetical protein
MPQSYLSSAATNGHHHPSRKLLSTSAAGDEHTPSEDDSPRGKAALNSSAHELPANKDGEDAEARAKRETIAKAMRKLAEAKATAASNIAKEVQKPVTNGLWKDGKTKKKNSSDGSKKKVKVAGKEKEENEEEEDGDGSYTAVCAPCP